jgi:metal-responsive CopG/Arc/MetJ family transcriptional regulator
MEPTDPTPARPRRSMNVRMPDELLDEFDAASKAQGLTRTSHLERLMRKAVRKAGKAKR